MKERKKRKRRARALECFERPRALFPSLSLSTEIESLVRRGEDVDRFEGR